jgi:curved DNA-binding protein CbpA
VQGQLGAKLVTDLIREIAQKQLSGLLRLTRGKSIKAIFFEQGEPKFAISNLTGEQLEHLLIKQSLVTAEQIEAAKARTGKVPRLAGELVDMGVMSPEAMRKAVREQVMEIILSMFEWVQGDYQFDERIRAAHDYTLDMSAADVILEGSRRMSKNQQLAEAIAPPDAVLMRARTNGAQIDSGILLPVESYILSRIDTPTAVGDVGMLSGLADTDAHRAVVSLVAAGFLKLVGDDRDIADDEAMPEADETADRLREEVARKLHFFSQADFYDILGVGRNATTAEIKASYYQLAKKFHPDRHRQPGYAELKPRLDALFALITQAYQTLSETAQRLVYDDRLKKPAAAFRTTPLKPPPAFVAEPQLEPKPASRPSPAAAPIPLSSPAPRPVSSEPPRPRAEAQASNDELHHKPGTESKSESQPRPSGPLPVPSVEMQGGDSSRNANGNQSQVAEHYFNQGRARYERKEYHAAVHLLREAVKLDASKSAYHFHLGIALLRNPRTRREADEHLQRAAELEPYNSQIRIKLGNLYKEVGLPKKAEAFFRSALQLDPDNRAARRELGGQSSKKAPEESIWKKDFGSIAKKLFKK